MEKHRAKQHLFTYPRRLWRRIGLRPRLAAAFTIVALLPLAALQWTQHQRIQSEALAAAPEILDLIADAQQRRINPELYRLQDLTKLVASRTQMQLSLAAYASDGNLAILSRAFNSTAASLEHEQLARRRSEQELLSLANSDALTGLCNRRHFTRLWHFSAPQAVAAS